MFSPEVSEETGCGISSRFNVQRLCFTGDGYFVAKKTNAVVIEDRLSTIC